MVRSQQENFGVVEAVGVPSTFMPALNCLGNKSFGRRTVYFYSLTIIPSIFSYFLFGLLRRRPLPVSLNDPLLSFDILVIAITLALFLRLSS